jgi:hypothetical protein
VAATPLPGRFNSQLTNLPGAVDESAEFLRAGLIEQRDERRCARYIVRDGADNHVRVTVKRDLRGQSNTDAVASSDQHHNGTFDQVLEHLHIRLNQEGLIDLDTWMIDSTAVRAFRASSGAGKEGGQKSR